jgi:hypothetical protein
MVGLDLTVNAENSERCHDRATESVLNRCSPLHIVVKAKWWEKYCQEKSLLRMLYAS